MFKVRKLLKNHVVGSRNSTTATTNNNNYQAQTFYKSRLSTTEGVEFPIQDDMSSPLYMQGVRTHKNLVVFRPQHDILPRETGNDLLMQQNNKNEQLISRSLSLSQKHVNKV